MDVIESRVYFSHSYEFSFEEIAN